MRRAWLLPATVVGGGLLIPLLMLTQMSAPAQAGGMGGVSCATTDIAVKGQGLTDEQARNAGAIIATARDLGVPQRGQVVAIATALTESDLRNLDHGDRDSVGLFQQRPSQAWGTVAQIMDPTYSTTSFFKGRGTNRGLLDVPNWQSMSVTAAAQAVQQSAFPNAYADQEQRAVNIVAGTGGSYTPGGCSPVAAPVGGQVSGYVAWALQQVGKPYVWGATGPDSFDCSGLIVYAWRQVGYQLKVRTSQQMYSVSTPVAAGQEQPGDLAFSEFGSDGPGHVLIVVRPGTVVEAPRTGIPVRIRQYSASEGLRFGRLPRSQMDPV